MMHVYYEPAASWNWVWFTRFWRVPFFRRDVYLDGGSRSFVIGPLTVYFWIHYENL